MLDLKPFMQLVAMLHPGNTGSEGFFGARWAQLRQRDAPEAIGDNWARAC
jgi:hypothetical protein